MNQNLIKVRWVVPRDLPNEITIAIVTADVDREALAHVRHFLPALRRAITAWCNSAVDGTDTLTLEHLIEEGVTAPLCRLLAAEGIYNLDIDAITNGTFVPGWDYDTNLFDLVVPC